MNPTPVPVNREAARTLYMALALALVDLATWAARIGEPVERARAILTGEYPVTMTHFAQVSELTGKPLIELAADLQRRLGLPVAWPFFGSDGSTHQLETPRIPHHGERFALLHEDEDGYVGFEPATFSHLLAVVHVDGIEDNESVGLADLHPIELAERAREHLAADNARQLDDTEQVQR
ncbi:hypothetical protein [Nocardia camponoti]|nr:hypothetical protein [Nocardia camponoti]